MDIFEAIQSFVQLNQEEAYIWVINERDSTSNVLSMQDKISSTTADLASHSNHQAFYKPKAKHSLFPDSLFFLILIGSICIAYVSAFHRKRFNMLMQTSLNWKLAKQIIRYEKVYSHPVNIALNVNFLISVSLFAGLIYFTFWPNEFSYNTHFLIFLGVILCYLLLKFILYKITAWLWQVEEVMEEYIFQTNLFNKYLGVAYLLLSALFIYSSISGFTIIALGIGLFVALFVMQLVRGIIIGRQSGGNLLLIILYLCTLEILPWLVAGKWIENQL